MAKYVKSPKHKTLTLAVGGGDRTVFPGEVLEGPQWKKFADLGFLVELKEEAASPAPTPAPVPAPAPVAEPEPAKAPEPVTEPDEPVLESKDDTVVELDEGKTTKSPSYSFKSGRRSSKKKSSSDE